MNFADVLIIVFVLIPTFALALFGILCLHTEYALWRAQQVQKKVWDDMFGDDADNDDEPDNSSILDYSKTDKV